MSHRYRRYSKRELLGSLQVDRIMFVSDLGLGPGANRWEVLRAFLKRGEARAERLVEDRNGFLILQSIPGRPNTGAIYLYRENLQAFFWLSFGNREDDLNGEDFQNALRVHRLIRLVGDGPRPHHRNRYRRRHPKDVDGFAGPGCSYLEIIPTGDSGMVIPLTAGQNRPI
jgi:hypothetical protein